MKTLIAILLASVLSLAAFAQSQDQTSGQGSQATQGSQSQTDTKASSGKSMSGTVSHDGKTFKNDADNKKYKVDNPDTLKGKEDQHVAMVVAVDPSTNTVHIIEVQQPQ
jgi:hypothetical protein